MAMPTMRLALAKTCGTPKCLDNKGGFAKPAILIEGPPQDLGIWAAPIRGGKGGSSSRIVHLAFRAHFVKSRLRVTLSANRDIFARIDVAEVNERLRRALVKLLARGHGEYV